MEGNGEVSKRKKYIKCHCCFSQHLCTAMFKSKYVGLYVWMQICKLCMYKSMCIYLYKCCCVRAHMRVSDHMSLLVYWRLYIRSVVCACMFSCVCIFACMYVCVNISSTIEYEKTILIYLLFITAFCVSLTLYPFPNKG